MEHRRKQERRERIASGAIATVCVLAYGFAIWAGLLLPAIIRFFAGG